MTNRFAGSRFVSAIKRNGQPPLSAIHMACAVAISLAAFQPALSCVSDDDLSVEQVHAAFEIAFSTTDAIRQLAISAEATNTNREVNPEVQRKLQQISTNAVARALQFGPPTRSETVANNSLVFRSVVVDINQNLPQPTVESFQRELPSTLLNLSMQWKRLQIDPELAYTAFQTCVNPTSRPDRIFLYSQESTHSRFPALIAPQSGAHEFVDWAAKANRIEDLKRLLREQQLDTVAEGNFLFFLIAMERQDLDEIRHRCQQLQSFVRQASSPELLRLIAACIMKAELSVRQLPEAAKLLQKTGEALLMVDHQSASQANFAATAAVDGFRILTSHALRTDVVQQQKSVCVVADVANRLFVNHRLPTQLAGEFQAAIADEILLAGLQFSTFSDQVKLAITERQLRFPKERHLVPLGRKSSPAAVIAHADMPVTINWASESSPDVNAIWIQQSRLNEIGKVSGETLFTISGLVSVGSPTSNCDGSLIAFHGRVSGTKLASENHVYVVDRNRKSITDIGPAVNPSFTASGRRLTCSRYTPNKGVWMVRSDGTNWQLLDQAGWASQFSPDGNKIAYTVRSKGRTSVAIYDLVSRDFSPQNKTYQDIVISKGTTTITGWPFCWAKNESLNSSAFWWFNHDQRQLLQYDVSPRKIDQPVATAGTSDVTNVVQDLNCFAGNQFVWLGPTSGRNKNLAIWKSGDESPVQINNRQILGVTGFAADQLLVLSKATTAE